MTTVPNLQTEKAPEWEDFTDNYGNYGDVAINLSPDWSRSRNIGDQAFVLSTVGHENGKADAFLIDNPRVQHQFRWVAPSDQNAISSLRSKKYRYCMRKEWMKNPDLWEWDGEGFILHEGQRLMARSKEHYLAQKEEEERAIKQRDRSMTPKYSGEDEVESAARDRMRGNNRDVAQSIERATIEDERGRPLKPLSKK